MTEEQKIIFKTGITHTNDYSTFVVYIKKEIFPVFLAFLERDQKISTAPNFNLVPPEISGYNAVAFSIDQSIMKSILGSMQKVVIYMVDDNDNEYELEVIPNTSEVVTLVYVANEDL
jgi:hypothetical protein